MVQSVTNNRRVAAHPPPRTTLKVAGREPQEAKMLLPADVPKQWTDTMMDHTGRQDIKIDVQLKKQATQDKSGIRFIVQGSYATLTAFTGQINEERKLSPIPHPSVMK